MTSLSGPEPPRWRGRFLLYAVGTPVLLYGLWGIVANAKTTRPVNWAAFFVGGALGHDLVFLPVLSLLLVAGAAGARRLPGRWRAPVQGGLLVSGLVVLSALPVVSGVGRRPDDPSTLPLPYLRNLLIVLVLVWLGALAAGLGTARRGAGRRGPAPAQGGAAPDGVAR